MGWDFGYKTIDEALRSLINKRTLKVACPVRCPDDDRYFEVWFTYHTGDKVPRLAVALMDQEMGDCSAEYGLKIIDVECGPYYYNVSPSLVDDCEIEGAGGYSDDWLSRWNKVHQRGTEIMFYDVTDDCPHCKGTGKRGGKS